jgi:hypothetical protein
MFEKKFNWKIWFFIVLFGGTVLMAAYVVFLLATNQIVDEDGLPLYPFIIGLMCFMICLVCSTYAATVIALLKQVTVYKNTAFRVDEEGIHNTLVFVYLFAFVIVCNVKLIPWSAVRYVDNEAKEGMYIRVRSRKVSASFVGRLIIGILGYHFCYSFTKTKLSLAERDTIMSYCISQPSCQTPDNLSWDVFKF